MIVVSDTSAIINLAAVEKLELLGQLYREVLLPPAVVAEIAAGGPSAPGAEAVEKLPWLRTRLVTNAIVLGSLQQQLDPGEAETIALALESQASLVLLDERRARQIAAQLGLHVTGLIGVLLEAKQRNLIGSVRAVLDQLIAKGGFWISQTLYRKTLEAAGE